MGAPAWEDLRDRFLRLAGTRIARKPIERIAVWLSSSASAHARAIAGERFEDNPTSRGTAVDALVRDTLRDLELAYGEVTYRVEAWTEEAPADAPSEARDIVLRGGLSLPGLPQNGTDDQRSRQQDRQNAQFFAEAFARASGAGFQRVESEAARAWARVAVLEAQIESMRTKLDTREDEIHRRKLEEKKLDAETKLTGEAWEKGSALLHTVLLSITSGGKFHDAASASAMRELVHSLEAQDMTKMLAALKPSQQLLALQVIKSEMDRSDGAAAKQLAEASILKLAPGPAKASGEK